jgi:hypothetical protein
MGIKEGVKSQWSPFVRFGPGKSPEEHIAVVNAQSASQDAGGRSGFFAAGNKVWVFDGIDGDALSPEKVGIEPTPRSLGGLDATRP